MPVRKSSLPRLPCPPIKENASMKQGIVTILRSDPEKTKSAPASIRRTLSADMSSKKWLELNGLFTPIKKIASFKELPINHPDSSSDSEEGDQNRLGRDEIWKSIQQQKEKNETPKPNNWGSLVKSHGNCKSDLPPPYVHPLVKRSASTLSEKSLEICTESLGSETGSDCFSPHPDEEKEEEGRKAFVREEMVKESNPFEDLQVKKYKVSPVRPFPPPIPSIAGGDGASLHMHSKRENGRLVLEAVSVPSRNYFYAQRQEGRLVLTLINAPDEAVEENIGEVFDNMEGVDENIDETNNNGDYSDEEEEGKEEEKIIVTKNVGKELEFVKSTRSGTISVHKTGLVMKKLVAQGNKNPTWTKKVVNMIVEDEGLEVPQSLPPLPWVARLIPTPSASGVGSFNAYDYFWRKNTTPCSFIAAPQPTAQIKNNHYNNKINGGNQDLVIIKEKEEKFPPYLRACKDGRRSLLIWEPYCIATS